jgi:subtilisin-like proprotein convertase family protein
MKKITLLLMIFALNFGFSQQNYWNKIDEAKLASTEKFERASNPSKSQIYNLNFQVFKNLLAYAPMENPELQSDLILQFPDFKGNLSRFKVFEAPVMEKELMDKFPSIKSYSAQGIDDRTATLRFSVTNFGLHVMSLSGEMGTYYIDTYTKDLNNYIVYSRNDIQPARQFGCLVQDEQSMIEDHGKLDNQIMVNDGNLRQYRLALSCTIEYSAFHLTAAGTPGSATEAEKKAVVLSAMVVSITRVNGIYERDMAVRLNLIANNEDIIFIDSDSFTNDDGFAMLDENQSVIDAVIDSANYDIGHVYSTGGGGVAQLGSVCNNTGKARGVTGSPFPVGDPFDVDYVCHEVGHQFGGNHTQNNNCQRSSTSSFEPGSASTIMGYAGICPPNVQNNSDAHFHARSILEMTNFVLSGSASCRQLSASGNTAPVVSAGSNFTIPNGTAFRLTGSATDANGDALTYCWEQYNNNVSTQPPLTTATAGPNFRSVVPSTSPTRFFPRFQDVLNGNLAPTWEVVPTVARTMTFALTVRDNRAGAGMTNRADMTVTTAAVGPFRVTSPSLNESINTSANTNITWDVAGTTANGINTANVNILISTDGGTTFTTLLANTPNDGNQVVTMPSTPAVNCRIMIEAVGNIFYAVSPNFALGYTVVTQCDTYTNSDVLNIPDGAGAPGYGPVVSNTINVPATGDISLVRIGLDVTHTYPQDLQIAINHPDGTQVFAWNRACGANDNFNVTLEDGAPAFTCEADMSGTFSPSSPFSAYNGKPSNGTWTLLTRDGYIGDTGSINSWFIEVCRETVTLSSTSVTLNDFVIFPNPNNGNFNIQFNSNSGNEIKVLVHDVRGRQVFGKNFTNSGLFNENVNLENVQSGVYMVTVLDGAQKQVKKIVIQ